MAWLCSCGCVNGGTNKYCPASLTANTGEHKQVSSNSPDWITAALAAKELHMTPNEELFAKFYNHEKILVKDMDLVLLREHRDELQHIAFEAKARLIAADDETRERKAKSTTAKEWTVTDNVVVSDAINAVKTRKERMTKMDKLRSQLLSAGIDEATVKEMIAGMEKRATKELKTVTFNVKTVETSAVQVIPSKKPNAQASPFNPASLGFTCTKCKQNPCRCDG